MKRARLYVGYIFGFWESSTPQQDGVNDLSPKTLGGCFPACAGGCGISPESTPARQTASATLIARAQYPLLCPRPALFSAEISRAVTPPALLQRAKERAAVQFLPAYAGLACHP